MLDIDVAIRRELERLIHRYLRRGEEVAGDGLAPYAAVLFQFGSDPGMYWLKRLIGRQTGNETYVGIWRISESGTEPLPFERRETVEIDTDDCSLIVWFWINLEVPEVYVNWYVGPLCGWGEKHKVLVHGETVSFDKGETFWVS